MDKKQYRIQTQLERIDNTSHNMFIHGYLQAAQNYVCAFGLESTAGYILKMSGIYKDDFIRCQIENGHETERMLRIIETAFSK